MIMILIGAASTDVLAFDNLRFFLSQSSSLLLGYWAVRNNEYCLHKQAGEGWASRRGNMLTGATKTIIFSCLKKGWNSVICQEPNRKPTVPHVPTDLETRACLNIWEINQGKLTFSATPVCSKLSSKHSRQGFRCLTFNLLLQHKRGKL